MKVFVDNFDIKTSDGEFVSVTGIINAEQCFGILVGDGRVHVFHLGSGGRISTEKGFATLLGAFAFIDLIYPMKQWNDDSVAFDQNEIDRMIACYREAINKEEAQ
jgi:hypothetical protein